MRITKRAIAVSALVLIAGCATVKQESFKLSNGRMVDYIHGKVDADGQTGVFRDAYVDGIPVLSHFGSGQSLLGQVLQGTASSAMIAGGMVGAAAMLRPARYNNQETNNLDNKQLQGQQQEQGQASFNDADSYSSSSAAAAASASNENKNYNSNRNSNYTKVKNIAEGGEGGGSGGVPGCQKAKNGC